MKNIDAVAVLEAPFKREHRYIVAKYKDMLAYLTEGQQRDLIELHKVIDAGREASGKRALECVCIEDDWPEYPVAWRMIEARMTGAKHGIATLDERRKDGMNGTRLDCSMSEVAELRAALAATARVADGREGEIVATVIKRGADRQWMSEALGSLPDGTYSLCLANAERAAIQPAGMVMPGKVRDFIDSVIEIGFEGGDLDGGAIQEWAETAGLIEPRTMTEACAEGERCRCADTGEFPLTCYRKTYRLAAPISEASASAGAGVVVITDPKAKGYRPACCDGGGERSVCCDDYCVANKELAEMRLTAPQPEAKAEQAPKIDRGFCEPCQGFGELRGETCPHCCPHQPASQTPEHIERVLGKGEASPLAKLAEWEECQRIADIPAVDELLRDFGNDPTGDGGVYIVREVLRQTAAESVTSAPSAPSASDAMAIAGFDRVMEERDRYHEVADDLAAQIATITSEDIGEHSSGNDPWRNAMLAADEFIAVQLRDFCAKHSAPTAPASATSAPSDGFWQDQHLRSLFGNMHPLSVECVLSYIQDNYIDTIIKGGGNGN